ncbi:MAG: hypothetical protein UZ21_OP11001000156 [Microgenomates bacterium OLB22]|nr:MAG: hypothetical protein UZ21_OP11001000156 [Microgenomates bacterium OLB22]
MYDPTQIVILVSVSLLTIILVVLGIQLFFILRDVKRILHRVENLTNTLEQFGVSLQGGYSEVVAFVMGVTKLFQIVELFGNRKKKSSASKES